MYLSDIHVENYKGIKDLAVSFQPDINVIVGENGSGKTALIDAIRLLYNLGEQQKSIYVNPEDFHRGTTVITITYEFRGLSAHQKGAFYQYLVLGEREESDFAKICLKYRLEQDRVIPSYYTGEIEGQKADPETFHRFVHYYLGALRDSTRDLLSSRTSILGKLLERLVIRNKAEATYRSLIDTTNIQLLKLNEVKSAEASINKNLVDIFRRSVENQIGLQVAESRIESVLNIIKPYLPHDRASLQGEGFSLKQNSLGFNNLIYIATVLGDISERQRDDNISHNGLLIEEPEAHLHPQLQLSLFAFLKNTNAPENSQLFVTTHSPTLTSKVPLQNLIVLSRGAFAINIHKCFEGSPPAVVLSDDENYTDDPKNRQQQLERYLDVTRSQLFFGKGVLFVEGISEELLIPAFSRILGFNLEDYRIELVNVDGTSFYPFLNLFIAADVQRRLPVPVSIITDDDRFPGSSDSKYSFKNIILNKALVTELDSEIKNGKVTSRIKNIEDSIKGSVNAIYVRKSFKTFEFDLVKDNIGSSKAALSSNLLWKFLSSYPPTEKKMKQVQAVVDAIAGEDLNMEDRSVITLLTWKALPAKAQFAQDLSSFLLGIPPSSDNAFVIPGYIKDALNHLTQTISP